MATGRPGDHGDPASVQAGWVLETLRRLRGWSLVETATKVGCSRTTLDAKRKGTSSRTLADVQQFADVLSVPAAVFSMDSEAFWLWWQPSGSEV